MGLLGDRLRKYELFRLCQKLKAQNFTGTTVLERPEGTTIIRFESGGPIFASSGEVVRSFPAFLLRKRRVERQQLKALLEESSQKGITLEDVIVSTGVMSNKEIIRIKKELSTFVFVSAFEFAEVAYRTVAGEVLDDEAEEARSTLEPFEGLFRAVLNERDTQVVSRMFRDRWDVVLEKTADFYRYLLPFRSVFFGEDITTHLMESEPTTRRVLEAVTDKPAALNQLFALTYSGMIAFKGSGQADKVGSPFSAEAPGQNRAQPRPAASAHSVDVHRSNVWNPDLAIQPPIPVSGPTVTEDRLRVDKVPVPSSKREEIPLPLHADDITRDDPSFPAEPEGSGVVGAVSDDLGLRAEATLEFAEILDGGSIPGIPVVSVPTAPAVEETPQPIWLAEPVEPAEPPRLDSPVPVPEEVGSMPQVTADVVASRSETVQFDVSPGKPEEGPPNPLGTTGLYSPDALAGLDATPESAEFVRSSAMEAKASDEFGVADYSALQRVPTVDNVDSDALNQIVSAALAAEPAPVEIPVRELPQTPLSPPADPGVFGVADIQSLLEQAVAQASQVISEVTHEETQREMLMHAQSEELSSSGSGDLDIESAEVVREGTEAFERTADSETDEMAIEALLSELPPVPPRPETPELGTEESIERILEDVYRSMLTRTLYDLLNSTPMSPLSALREAANRLRTKYGPRQYRGFIMSTRAMDILDKVRNAVDRAELILTNAKARRRYDEILDTQYPLERRAWLHQVFAAERDYQAGLRFYNGGDFGRALDMFHRAVTGNAYDPDYIAWRGQSLYMYHKANRRDDQSYVGRSRAEFEKALALDPRHARSLLFMARLELEQGDTDASSGWYSRLQKVEPGNEEAAEVLERLRRENPSRKPADDKGWTRFRGMFGKKK